MSNKLIGIIWGWKEWIFLIVACLLAAVQAAAQWAVGARLTPLHFYESAASGDGSWILMIIFALVLFVAACSKKANASSHHLSVSRRFILSLGILVLFFTLGSYGLLSDLVPVSRYWIRKGETYRLNKVGGPQAMASDAFALIDDVRTGKIAAPDGWALAKELRSYPALGPWHFVNCDVNVEISRVILVLGFHQKIELYQDREGFYLERTYSSGGARYWKYRVKS